MSYARLIEREWNWTKIFWIKRNWRDSPGGSRNPGRASRKSPHGGEPTPPPKTGSLPGSLRPAANPSSSSAPAAFSLPAGCCRPPSDAEPPRGGLHDAGEQPALRQNRIVSRELRHV